MAMGTAARKPHCEKLHVHKEKPHKVRKSTYNLRRFYKDPQNRPENPSQNTTLKRQQMPDEKRTAKSVQVPVPVYSSVKQAAFLAAYASCGMVGKAAKLAKMHKDTHYQWLRSDPSYKLRFEVAHQQAITTWEDEVSRRAFVGTRKPVYQSGKKVGSVLEYSDGLAQFMLRANNRDKYGDKNQLAVTGTFSLGGMQAAMKAARSRAAVEEPDAPKPQSEE
jgi:hypothetical protein